jgi:hypothetical protein
MPYCFEQELKMFEKGFRETLMLYSTKERKDMIRVEVTRPTGRNLIDKH